MNTEDRLRAIKSLHTVIWAFLAGCVLAIPLVAWRGHFGVVLGLIALVALEVTVLAANGGSCPLTAIAGRYTRDRRDNFDIYLPEWLAGRTKIIFGPLFLLGLIIAAVLWRAPLP